jgi:hypothetical protein
MVMKRSFIAAFAILVCLMFAWATGAGRPYPANAGGVIDPTCTSSSPCIEYDNNSTGSGVKSLSVAGNGFNGTTQVHSTSTTNGKAGVFGNDVGTGSFNSGVHGQTTNGTGVLGVSTNGVGVTGQSTNSPGVRGVSNISDAVQGTIGSGVASSFHAGVAGIDSSTSGNTNEGVYGQSTNGTAIQAVSFNGIGVQASGGVDIGGFPLIDYPALSVNGNALASDLIDACNNAGLNPCRQQQGQPFPQFFLTYPGDIFITGQIITSGPCSGGCASTPSAGEKRVRLYTPQESLPTVEDFGQAQLVGGRTYVRIDPAFANTIDSHATYMVLITPEGDSNGLYVANKTTAGFEVHENRAGRSTLAFSYRIVAKPFGEHPVRLRMITVSRPGRSLPQRRIR